MKLPVMSEETKAAFRESMEKWKDLEVYSDENDYMRVRARDTSKYTEPCTCRKRWCSMEWNGLCGQK